jgi:cyclin H
MYAYYFYFRVTCVYLACKIEEFNVTIGQFVRNVRGDREKATGIILNNELMLMSAMKFHLTIHNPYRPVEGFLIDIKARYGQFDPERIRQHIDEFLDKVLLTDVPLLYPPSQVLFTFIVP